MYWFDLRQQFGVPGVALAALGFCYVLWRWPRRAIFLLLFYAANLAFAWTYNVGDAYIFFLPSHYVVALCAGAGIAAVGAFVSRDVESHGRHRGSVRCCCSIPRGAATTRCRPWIGAGTGAPSNCSTSSLGTQLPARPQDAVYGVDTNWQVQNAFEYFMRERRPGVPWFITEQLEWLQEGRSRCAVQ